MGKVIHCELVLISVPSRHLCKLQRQQVIPNGLAATAKKRAKDSHIMLSRIRSAFRGETKQILAGVYNTLHNGPFIFMNIEKSAATRKR